MKYADLKGIEKLYKSKILNEGNDESGREGYWDLAGDLASQLVSVDDPLFEQLQSGFYYEFQKILVRKEYYQ